MANCEGCPSKDKCSSKDKENCGKIQIEYNPKNKVKHVIAVMSGKGGVGKSTVSVLLAKELNKRGYKVGVLDADITGPSIPRLVGTVGKYAAMVDGEIMPVVSSDGIKTMSLNYFVEEESQPVVWRGPMISGTVKQFWTDVIWGEIDFLVVDLPPGTGDVTLTVMQQMPVTGVVGVGVPQSMVTMIVTKAIKMMQLMKKPVFGVVENMSYIQCPDCGTQMELYEGKFGYKELEDMGIDILAEYPMVPDLMAQYADNESIVAKETARLADAVVANAEAAAADDCACATCESKDTCDGDCSHCGK
ncbi:MAG: Mrp/NBP35 family ATP-binding protein [Clostridia bacterium]|nr:Mrp/NBP35 family ATP-binding protein [Clostridia bacterium]